MKNISSFVISLYLNMLTDNVFWMRCSIFVRVLFLIFHFKYVKRVENSFHMFYIRIILLLSS